MGGCDAIGYERCLPTSRDAQSFAQAGFIALTGALANDLRDHVYCKWNEKAAVRIYSRMQYCMAGDLN